MTEHPSTICAAPGCHNPLPRDVDPDDPPSTARQSADPSKAAAAGSTSSSMSTMNRR